MYSHVVYDIVPGAEVIVRQPHIVILEGLNVLQVSTEKAEFVSDYFDFSIYVDAATAEVRRWYVERFLRLRDTAFREPMSYFHRYAELDHDAAVAQATQLWDTINGPNLEQNIRPTRGRATLVLHKDAYHAVEWIRLRKL